MKSRTHNLTLLACSLAMGIAHAGNINLTYNTRLIGDAANLKPGAVLSGKTASRASGLL